MEEPQKLDILILYKDALKQIKTLEFEKGQLLSEIEHLQHESQEVVDIDYEELTREIERLGKKVTSWKQNYQKLLKQHEQLKRVRDRLIIKLSRKTGA